MGCTHNWIISEARRFRGVRNAEEDEMTIDWNAWGSGIRSQGPKSLASLSLSRVLKCQRFREREVQNGYSHTHIWAWKRIIGQVQPWESA